MFNVCHFLICPCIFHRSDRINPGVSRNLPEVSSESNWIVSKLFAESTHNWEIYNRFHSKSVGAWCLDHPKSCQGFNSSPGVI